jgi:hypothetical protein
MKILVQSLMFKVQSINLTVLGSYGLMVFLIFPLNAQNPYEYAEEELFLTSLGVRERYESVDCTTAREFISRFHNTDAKGNDKEKYNTMRAISFFQCSESYAFFENQIKRSLIETDRCHAIMFLAWMMNPDYLPIFMEYAKKEKLSMREKAAVATAFMVFSVHGTYPDLKEKAISMLDEICYDAPFEVLVTCILNYLNLEGRSAIKFFTSHLEKEEYKLYAALFLAELGEHKQTFPIFAATLSSEDEYEVHTAIMGLEEIGTDEAIELIENLPPEKNRFLLRERLINFDLKEIKKGD